MKDYRPEVQLRGSVRILWSQRFPRAFQGRRNIDHIALSEDWQVVSLGVISNFHEGKKLPDHFDVVADLSAQHFH